MLQLSNRDKEKRNKLEKNLTLHNHIYNVFFSKSIESSLH